VNIRYPNITGKTEREQIAQIKSFLRYLVDQMNNTPALNTDVDVIAKQAAEKISFTLDKEGNLNYEVEE
jgi:hypothetical protein